MAAHINGDMWVALKDKYSYDTIKKYSRHLFKFQQAFNTLFDSVYATTGKYKKLKSLHFFTLGLDRYIGKATILRWRRKQVAMALLYYTNLQKCARKERRIQKNDAALA